VRDFVAWCRDNFTSLPYYTDIYGNGSENWSLTLWEEHRLRVFENRVLRRIFRRKSVEVAGGCIKPHTEELHNLYASPNNIRVTKSMRTRLAVHVARMGGLRSVNNILVRKPEVKRLLRRPRSGWQDNIGIDVREIWYESVD
jgi:hypothetical protein